MCNSCYAISPLRMKFEKETRQNSRAEGDRLRNEENNLQPFLVPDTNLVIDFCGNPTMIDTKCKSAWVGENCSNKCPICGATARQMSQRYGPFQPKPGTLRYGFSQLHVKLGYLRWHLKAKKNSEFKDYECRGEQNKASKAYWSKWVQEKLLEIGLRVDFVRPGYGTSNIGKTDPISIIFFQKKILETSKKSFTYTYRSHS